MRLVFLLIVMARWLSKFKFSRVLGIDDLINEVVILFKSLFVLISNFRVGRYIWYQSRDFNNFMGSLGSEPIELMCVCVICLVMRLKYELLDLPVKNVAHSGYGK